MGAVPIKATMAVGGIVTRTAAGLSMVLTAIQNTMTQMKMTRLILPAREQEQKQ